MTQLMKLFLLFGCAQLKLLQLELTLTQHLVALFQLLIGFAQLSLKNLHLGVQLMVIIQEICQPVLQLTAFCIR